MMFGTVYWASQLASEVHVRNSELQDDGGHAVSTVSRRDRIDGLHYPREDRRLNNASDFGIVAGAGDLLTLNETGHNSSALPIVNESTSTDSAARAAMEGFTGRMEISQDYFQSTWDGYMSGKSDWVVPFPDGSVRTVYIQGMSPTFAWGICGACPGGNVQWEARCPAEDDSNECTVEWQEGRRLSVEAVSESPLLARARARRQDNSGSTEREGMERSLGGK